MGMTKEIYEEQAEWEYYHIQEILDEAGRVGMRREVEETAKSYLIINSDMNIVQTYDQAFNELIK